MVEVVSEASAFKPRRKNLSNFSSNSLTPPTNIFQELQVERYKLNYLNNCKYFKRPPQSLRVSGSNALTAHQKRLLISEFESKALVIATQNKKEDIKKLETLVLALEVDLHPFTKKQKKKNITCITSPKSNSTVHRKQPNGRIGQAKINVHVTWIKLLIVRIK